MVSPNMQNITSFVDFFQLANTNTQGWFWAGITVLIFIVILIALLRYGEEVSGITAGFVTFILSLWLTYAGLVAWGVTTFYLGVTLLLLIYVAWTRKGSDM